MVRSLGVTQLAVAVNKMDQVAEGLNVNKDEFCGQERWLRATALVALSEDLGLPAHAHTVAHNHLPLQLQRSHTVSWLLQAPDTHVVHIHA